MKIWMIVAVCAFVFLVCFLLDTLFKHLFPKSKLEKSKQAVRPARRSATFGVILLFVPVVVLLFFMPKGGDTLLLIGCIAALIFGVILLVIAFLVSPLGLPMAAAWLVGKVQDLRYAIQDAVYG